MGGRVGKASGTGHVSITLKHSQIICQNDVLFANLGLAAGQNEDDVFAIILN